MKLSVSLRDLSLTGFPTAAAVAFAFAIGILLVGQTSDFRALREVKSLSCETAISPPVETPESTIVSRCRADLDMYLSDPSTGQSVNLAVLVPIYRDVLSVSLNGKAEGEARLNQWRMPARLTTVPTFIVLPMADLRPDKNSLEISVSGLAGRNPMIGKVYIGREDAVMDQFRQLRFAAEVLPTLILGGQAALSLIFFTIWNRRRQETAFGWFAVVLLLDTLRGSAFIPALGGEPDGVSYWSLLVPFSSAAYVMFTCALVNFRSALAIGLAWFGPTVVAVLAAVSTPAVATAILLPLGIAVVFFNLLWASGVLAIGSRRGIVEARLLLFCTLLFAALVLHDVLLSMQVFEGAIAIARPGLLVLLIAMITLMMNRFTSAMTELDQTASTLLTRTFEIEQQLKSADELLREQRESTILAQERARLMRDLHDGLGGEMVAVLALAERDQGKAHEIAYHARAALTDMRLIIASLEDYGGDLAMALGAWKERAEPQILAADMVLQWEPDVPHACMNFGPKQILEIMRILQEALTNAIHHSCARNITFSTQLVDNHLVLSVADDGTGICPNARAGNGLINMQDRARALGGELTIKGGKHGTSIFLRLPLQQDPWNTSPPLNRG